MKKYLLLLCFFFSFHVFLPSSNAGETPARLLHLTSNRINLMIVGEEAEIRTSPMNKNISHVECIVRGGCVSLVNKTGNPQQGYTFRFRALRPGEAVILEEISKFGKSGKNVETKNFNVKVYSMDQMPEVSLASLFQNPKKYTGRLFMVSGTSRGWGHALKTNLVLGTMITRSDWIIEDKTGAAYVSGIPLIKAGKPVKIVSELVEISPGKWGLTGKRTVPVSYQEDSFKTVANSSNEFAIDLYKRLSRNNDKNVFFSPISVSIALAMTYAGARGNTEKQMAEVFHFTLPQQQLHPAFSHLVAQILNPSPDKKYELAIANALWGQKGYCFLPAFTELIKKNYDGAFFTVDFAGHTEEARKKINAWIEKRTYDKIRDLLHRGDITNLTRLVLTNAIYFKGDWASKFETQNTKPMPFYTPSGKPVKVPMMYQEARFPYFENNSVQVLELPYAGNDLSMVIILPARKQSLKDFENKLTLKNIRYLAASARQKKVKVYFPRFELKTRYYLGKVLKDMGMPDAFSPMNADFSGITGNRNLYIYKVIHQAFVKVNEEGTEASAATAVVMNLRSIVLSPVFKADHPFIFAIMHKKTGSILFMGRVLNPKENNQ